VERPLTVFALRWRIQRLQDILFLEVVAIRSHDHFPPRAGSGDHVK
jgi:hypothetical protein